jgi:hypothetical protein
MGGGGEWLVMGRKRGGKGEWKDEVEEMWGGGGGEMGRNVSAGGRMGGNGRECWEMGVRNGRK